ncbi:hypothetical protein DRT30_22710 [Salmonella enterica subsp. enterica serovar Ealing]|nr:hypothetical protein [Salmonella enterica subsp. enterica serovar Ealing]
MSTQITGMDALDDYTNRVRAAISTIPFIKTVGIYPEIPDGFETPAIFFEVESWVSTDETVPGTALGVELNCNLYLLREFAADQYGQKARNAALYVSGWINGRQFGPATKPAVFGSAEEGDWQKSGKSVASHSVWCVSFSQIVGVGADPFDYPSKGKLKQIFVGLAPDIGAAHEEDYFGPIPQSGE